MATIHNEIIIESPIEKIWEALSNVEQLEKYDPTVKKSTATTDLKSGIGAARKVNMKDGKNWFEETCTVFRPSEKLVYELTACSFPVHGLSHSYTFERIGNSIKVMQVMKYNVKFGLFGKLLDALMIRKQSDKGIKLFFEGLKIYLEKK